VSAVSRTIPTKADKENAADGHKAPAAAAKGVLAKAAAMGKVGK
jgi:hypothetical protein